MDLAIFLVIFLFVVPFMVIMVLESRKRRGQPQTEEGDEEARESQMGENPGEEELEEGEHDP